MHSLFLNFSTSLRLSRNSRGALQICGPDGCWSLQGVSRDVEWALRRGVTREGLADLVNPEELAKIYFLLSQLDSGGLLCRSVMGDDGPLATWIPLVAGTIFEEHAPLGSLSRFVFVRRKEGRSLMESPLRSSRVVLYDWRATAVLGAYPEDPGLLPTEQTQALLCLLANGGRMDGGADPPLWDFASLMFHSRSRTGRSRGPHAMVVPVSEPEVEKEEQPTHCLIRPGNEELSRSDSGFHQVVESRRSVREHGSVPMTFAQLSEFLWRVGGDDSGRRPYPCAGQAYELEISLAVHRCGGVEAGLYRYLPRSHGLQAIGSRYLEELLNEARVSCGASTRPQILVLLSARFAKMMRKYRAIAYSNILKDVGVVFQTMALTATAMNLAACPIGAGDSDLFCRAFGTDYATESSVGELILGTVGTSIESSGYD